MGFCHPVLDTGSIIIDSRFHENDNKIVPTTLSIRGRIHRGENLMSYEIIDKNPSPTSLLRPTWPNQVLSPDELKIGHRYIPTISNQRGIGFTINSAPYQESMGTWWVSIEYQINNRPMMGEASLADKGIVPYSDDGTWNQTNYLVHDPDCDKCRSNRVERNKHLILMDRVNRPDYVALRLVTQLMVAAGLAGGVGMMALVASQLF